MSGEAPPPPRKAQDPIYAMRPAAPRPTVTRPRSAPSSRGAAARAPSPRPAWFKSASTSVNGACSAGQIDACDGPTHRDTRDVHNERLNMLRTGQKSGGPRPRSAGRCTVPSHIVPPREPRTPRQESRSSSAVSQAAKQASDPRTALCLKLLTKRPADFCIVIQSKSVDTMERTSEIRSALQEVHPTAPVVTLSRSALSRPGSVEVLFFAACDLSLKVIFSSPPLTLRGKHSDGWPTPDEVVDLVNKRCREIVSRLKDTQQRLEAVTG